MTQSQFALTWDGYQGNICKGFSSLQQNGELVDMTLAADGHLVKVHQILIALASPYFKELIRSAPCPHPVIFLNNVSHKTLCNLLEYIYTGEVLVPADNLTNFFETAKMLHIKGLQDMGVGDIALDSATALSETFDDVDQKPVNVFHQSGIKRIGFPSGDTMESFSVPAGATKIQLKHDTPGPKSAKKRKLSPTPDDTSYSAMDDSVDMHDDDDLENFSAEPASTALTTSEKPKSNLQFTVSNRGSLQVILNRYMYNLQSTARRSGIRRWRCVDYRNKRCLAFVITKGNVVLNRANLHNHPFHDKKILMKIERNAVFSAIDEVKGYTERSNDTNQGTDTDDPQDSSQDFLMLPG